MLPIELLNTWSRTGLGAERTEKVSRGIKQASQYLGKARRLHRAEKPDWGCLFALRFAANGCPVRPVVNPKHDRSEAISPQLLGGQLASPTLFYRVLARIPNQGATAIRDGLLFHDADFLL